LNQLIENIQDVNYRNYRDSIAIVKSTINSLWWYKCNTFDYR